MSGLNRYDFSARWYDYAVPGFTTPDPLLELHPWESPYAYCDGNPINRMDPSGLAWYTSGTDVGFSENDWEYAQTSNGQIWTNRGSTWDFEIGGVQYHGDARGVATRIDERDEGKERTVVEGGVYDKLLTTSTLIGFFADISKEAKFLGSIGIWRDYNKIKIYKKFWATGNGTVKTFGSASVLGYSMFGLAIIAESGKFFADEQSGSTTLINVGINAVFLKMPLVVGIGYQVGSLVQTIQTKAMDLLVKNGHGDNPAVINNVTW